MSEPPAALESESGVEKTPCPSTRTSSFSSADGADFDGIRRAKRSSVASQVTFAGLFGDADDDAENFDDVSTEPGADDGDSITLIRRETPKRSFPVEQILFLYLLSSSLSRVNLKQAFRIRQCLTVLKLNESQCQELFKLEDVKTDDLIKASDSLIDARLGLEYAAGSILVFLLSQYLVKYGLKHALLFCLVGSLSAHLSIYAALKFTGAEAVFAFLATIPSILSGGEILMSTITCTHIGTETMRNARRGKFLIYQFCVLLPSAISQLLDAYVLPEVNHTTFELWAIIIVAAAILLSCFCPARYAEGFETHSVKQRMRCSLGFVSFKETIMCFSKQRQCLGRTQVFLLILILSTTPLYFDFFSEIQAEYMLKFFNWDSQQFVASSSTAIFVSYLFCLVSGRAYKKWIRALDPTIAAVCFVCLAVSYCCLMGTVFSDISYYGSLTLMAVSVLGTPVLLSHLCQLLEKSEIAPIFAVTCALERISHVVAHRLWKLILYMDQSQLTFVITFAARFGYVVLLTFGCLFMVSTTRNYGYPSHFYDPAIGPV